MPFTQAEMVKTLAAVDIYGKTAGTRNAQRLRAFILLLRYSGMRIGDTVGCGVDRIEGNRLFLYTQKTNTPVYCVLPDFVIKAHDATPRTSERFYFWSGASTLRSAVGKWQRRLQRLFKLAEVPQGHAHRFRDSFACGLLEAGVPMDRVSVLLGHQSIRVTERHYAPWTASRQELIEADLARVWSQDPVALLEANPHVPRPARRTIGFEPLCERLSKVCTVSDV
jgi:integrase/recombinase XerD